jgi:Abortive infection alpha
MARKPQSRGGKAKSSAKISAKTNVGLGASVGYNIKKEIKQNIPQDVTRARAAAWLQLISPLTEWAGLKSDELRFRREALRLQREETLTRIANSIKRNKVVAKTPIPTKFMVSFLEKASLEAPDDPLVELWARLLASAANNYGSHHLHFVALINQMDAKQAQLLEDLIGTESAREAELAMDHISIALTNVHSMGSLRDDFREKEVWSADEIEAKVWHHLNRIAVEPVHASFDIRTSGQADPLDGYYDIEVASNYQDQLQVDYAILESLRLIELVETGFFDINNFSVTLVYYHLSTLGLEFAKACGLVK